MRRVWAVTDAIGTPLTSKMPIKLLRLQEIDHREGCHDQPKAPDQHVAHRGVERQLLALRLRSRLRVRFLASALLLLELKESADFCGFNRGERTHDESHARAR
jgi:hypothetical protein